MECAANGGAFVRGTAFQAVMHGQVSAVTRRGEMPVPQSERRPRRILHIAYARIEPLGGESCVKGVRPKRGY